MSKNAARSHIRACGHWPRTCYALTLWLLLLPTTTARSEAAPRALNLSYVVYYQGVLSAGVKLDIGRVDLRLQAGPAAGQNLMLQASTLNYQAAELIKPVRLCYLSSLDPMQGETQQADWWIRVGSKISRGRLLFDDELRQVSRLRVKQKLVTGTPAGNSPAKTATDPRTPAHDRDQAPFPASGRPMETLGMLLWLRHQTLAPGAVLQLPVSNGHNLAAYRIQVEGEETMAWNDRPLPVQRLLLQPRMTDDSEPRPSRLWLGSDPERLPLRFSSEQAYGRFDLHLQPSSGSLTLGCPIPEAVGLMLPET